MSRNKCLTLSDRIIIETGIKEGSKKKSIADTIGKDESTIAKEIRKHREKRYTCSLPAECANYRRCKTFKQNRELCSEKCDSFVKFICKRRDRTPGACNGCHNYSSCRYTKYYYSAKTADEEYKNKLVESREGFNIDNDKVKELAEIIVKPIKNGQSVYAVLANHKEIKLTEKTIYTYIENGLFKEYGLDTFALRRQLSRKLPKAKKNLYKTRTDRKFLINRTWKNLNELKESNPNIKIAQMDTVYNDISNGPFVQTIKIVNLPILIGVFHKEKTASAMVEGLNMIEKALGSEIFKKYIDVITPDRGSEFYDAEGLETSINGGKRCRIYYCDPMQSSQKGSLENNHEDLRYVLPKEKNLTELGLTSQDALNKVLSHINSYPKEKLNGKSPIELVEFLAPDLAKKLNDFGITQIPKDEIVLNPSLLKK